jgi:NTP pyrophosphatase (non-canonical NTP hydrolase)
MINKKLDYDTELLVITMEECGELIEACSKAIRCEDYENNERLIEEFGDVYYMLSLIMERGLVKADDVSARIKVKQEKLKKWSNLINE